MGKQTMPRSIAALDNALAADGSVIELTRQDAEELYASVPKRVLFDALWEAMEDRYCARPGTVDAGGTIANVRAIAKKHF